MEKRPKLQALEKNILKYRALQMVLLLHEVESLKSFVLRAIRATDKIFSEEQSRLPEGEKKIFRKAWNILVSEEIISEEESQDIQKIIGMRNQIGHSIHKLVSDISGTEFLADNEQAYDHFALSRLEQYRDKIQSEMRSKFVLPASFRELSFEEAEKTYKEELKRLGKRIERQYALRMHGHA